MSEQLVKRETVKTLVAMPGYRQRFDEVLGAHRASAFLGSLTALTADKYLAACEPKSVLAAAFVAATLDLPINKSLGFAWVVPYNGVGQFQIGWKGVVQLALRSGQYRRLNAFKVCADAFLGLDDFAEPIIDNSKLDDAAPAVGYAVVWELLNGFRKTIYWSKEKTIAHAERYSQARKKKRTESPWYTHEDEMCLKTVLSNGLRAYGPMSVQMQRAMIEDQAVRYDLDGEPQYIDNEQTAADLPAMPQEAAPKKRGRGPGKKQQAEAAAPPEDDTESAEEKAELDELWSQAVELGQRCQRTEEVSMAKADAAMKEGKASLISLIQALEELVIAVERNRP